MSDLPVVSNVEALSPLDLVNPDSITALFDKDPTEVSEAQLTQLIVELRRRADVNAATAAAKEAAPKTKAPRVKAPNTPALQALADKPIEEVTVDDLL